MNPKITSILLDVGQIISLIVIIIDGVVIPNNVLSLVLFILAVALIFYSVWAMRMNRFYQVPDIKKQKTLVTNGPYTYIRNPMYTSQLLLTLSIIINKYSAANLVIFLFLFWIFIQKMDYEERLLKTHFGLQFKEYVSKTKKLIPYIY